MRKKVNNPQPQPTCHTYFTCVHPDNDLHDFPALYGPQCEMHSLSHISWRHTPWQPGAVFDSFWLISLFIACSHLSFPLDPLQPYVTFKCTQCFENSTYIESIATHVAACRVYARFLKVREGEGEKELPLTCAPHIFLHFLDIIFFPHMQITSEMKTSSLRE